MSGSRAMFSLKDRVVMLTGASSGLGRRCAETLCEWGATVAAVARRREELEILSKQCSGVTAFPYDLSDLEGIPHLVEAVLSSLGPIDVLINNAGSIGDSVRAENETLEYIRAIYDLNVIAPTILAQCVLPGMRERSGGSIINITSIAAHVGIARFPHASYAGTKGALRALTTAWAVQWARYGVRVNSVAPGFMENDDNRDLMSRDDIRQWVSTNSLLDRVGQADDLDGAIVFLASDASRYVTGQTVLIDGGWTAR